jgi:hypothetical protein
MNFVILRSFLDNIIIKLEVVIMSLRISDTNKPLDSKKVICDQDIIIYK